MITETMPADMALMSKIFTADTESGNVDFCDIPIRFKLNGKEFFGIPDCFERTVRREIVDANITRWIYEGKCSECSLSIRVTHNEYRDYPVSEWYAEFTNNGSDDTPIISDIMLGGKIDGAFESFIHGNGDTCGDNGYEWYTDDVKNDPVEIHTNDSTSCNGAFPYMKLVFDGFICRAAIGWPVGWRASVARVENGIEYLCGQLRCNMKIHPGETMRTPTLTLMITSGDEDKSRNLWRKWYIAHIIPRENGKPIEPMLCLHYYEADGHPEFTGATEENQIMALREYVSRGLTPDIWWIDAGWYKCNYSWPDIGTWKPDEERFPNGLKPIGDECNKYGTRLLLWFEPERVVPGTELHEEHHEWLIPLEDESEGHRGNHLLNLGNRQALEWLIERVDGIIKSSGIKIYRQDFNFNPQKCFEKAEAPDRIGAVENLHAQGYLKYWDELIFRNPGLWIDSCASGGRRNDLETMRRAVPLHYTDVGYGIHEIKQKQFREMHEWIPYFRSHNMSWDKQFVEENIGKWVDNDEFSFQCAMVPAVTYMTAYNAPEEEFERTKRMEKIWRRAAELALFGDYYPLSECRKSTEDWYACQFDEPENNRGYVQFIRNIKAPDESYTAKMHVQDGKLYTFTDSSNGTTFKKTSDELKNGLTLELAIRQGKVLFYETTDI